MKKRRIAVLASLLLVSSAHGADPKDIISADELNAARQKGGVVILDARNKKIYDDGHIEGAVLPLPDDYYRRLELYSSGLVPKAPEVDKELKAAMQKFPRDAKIVTYCNANCGASKVLQVKLFNLGFTDVRSMEEGYQIWEQKGYPVVRAPRLDSAGHVH